MSGRNERASERPDDERAWREARARAVATPYLTPAGQAAAWWRTWERLLTGAARRATEAEERSRLDAEREGER